MAILGGSPLGLINVGSNKTQTGQSNFNDGSILSVDKYNARIVSEKGNSLFSGLRLVRAWPDIKTFENTLPGAEILDEEVSSAKKTLQQQWNPSKSLHSDDVYDTSIMNIIEHLQGTKGALRTADFAYLKDVGVYPNNRLMIARRFAVPVGDNIIAPRKKNASGKFTDSAALATLISWVKPGDESFISFSFGENWDDAEADFKALMNKIGNDIFGNNSKMGGIMESLGNIVPLGGFTEITQRKVMAKLGIIDGDTADSVPAGNPNLIKEAKRRKTIPQETAGSGLNCSVSIKMTCEYELKFISGIDPTIVWMDILGVITRFGTSQNSFYGLTGKASETAEKWFTQPVEQIQAVAKLLVSEIEGIKNQLATKLQGIYESKENELTPEEEKKKVIEAEKERRLKDPAYKGKTGDAVFTDNKGDKYYELYQEGKKKKARERDLAALKKGGERILGVLGEFLRNGLNTIAKKYKIEMMGIVHALSGLPSTPWHITIGNPLRPVFCAGDMYTQSVNLTLGPHLAFNDLPSSIKAEFTLTNARPWGLGEIMAKFNSGYLRTVDTQRTFLEINPRTVGDKIVTAGIGSFGFQADTADPDELAKQQALQKSAENVGKATQDNTQNQTVTDLGKATGDGTTNTATNTATNATNATGTTTTDAGAGGNATTATNTAAGGTTNAATNTAAGGTTNVATAAAAKKTSTKAAGKKLKKK